MSEMMTNLKGKGIDLLCDAQKPVLERKHMLLATYVDEFLKDVSDDLKKQIKSPAIQVDLANVFCELCGNEENLDWMTQEKIIQMEHVILGIIESYIKLWAKQQGVKE